MCFCIYLCVHVCGSVFSYIDFHIHIHSFSMCCIYIYTHIHRNIYMCVFLSGSYLHSYLCGCMPAHICMYVSTSLYVYIHVTLHCAVLFKRWRMRFVTPMACPRDLGSRQDRLPCAGLLFRNFSEATRRNKTRYVRYL